MENLSELDKEYQKKYEEEMAQYKKRLEQQNKNYSANYREKKTIYDEARATVEMMHESYESTKATLAEAYGYNMIFPKYRNMSAIFTMLEYFQTGRCTELTGPNGAYNLYESELRQNIIINKLDNIIYKLDEIKANQFLLYSEMRNVNDHLDDLSTKVKALMDSSKQIEANTALTAHFSAITAQNTAAIAVISALN